MTTKDKIHHLINRPWMDPVDLESIYTILIALPLSGGMVGGALRQLAMEIDLELSRCIVKETK